MKSPAHHTEELPRFQTPEYLLEQSTRMEKAKAICNIMQELNLLDSCVVWALDRRIAKPPTAEHLCPTCKRPAFRDQRFCPNCGQLILR